MVECVDKSCSVSFLRITFAWCLRCHEPLRFWIGTDTDTPAIRIAAAARLRRSSVLSRFTIWKNALPFSVNVRLSLINLFSVSCTEPEIMSIVLVFRWRDFSSCQQTYYPNYYPYFEREYEDVVEEIRDWAWNANFSTFDSSSLSNGEIVNESIFLQSGRV